MIDPRTPRSDIERLNDELRQLRDKVNDLAAPSGTMAYQTVDKLKVLVEDIQQQLDDYIANDAYTKAQVDAKVASPGNINPGNVSASGHVSAPTARFDSGLSSVDVYNRVVSGAGYRATWTAVTGEIGYVPSSRRFKTDIEPHPFTLEQALALQTVVYRYHARIPFAPDSTPVELGLIAEEVHDLGLTWLVDYDEEGKPFGVRYDLVSLVVLEGMRELAGRVTRLEGGAA